MGSSNCGVFTRVMVMVDMDCHILAFWRHVIASVMVMVDMDCHISAVCRGPTGTGDRGNRPKNGDRVTGTGETGVYVSHRSQC